MNGEIKEGGTHCSCLLNKFLLYYLFSSAYLRFLIWNPWDTASRPFGAPFLITSSTPGNCRHVDDDDDEHVEQGGGDVPRVPAEHNCRRVHGPQPGGQVSKSDDDDEIARQPK